MAVANNEGHRVVLLEPEDKLNDPILSPVGENTIILVFPPLTV